MRVSEVMTKDISTIAPDSSVSEAARMMKELNIGALPVCDGDKPVGIITDRDITINAVAEGKDAQSYKVSDCMTAGVETCNENDDVNDAVQLMKDKQIRRVIITGDNDKVTGILSLGDIAVDMRDDNVSGEALERISQPS